MQSYIDTAGLIKGINYAIKNKQSAYLFVEDWINEDLLIRTDGDSIICDKGTYSAEEIIKYCSQKAKKVEVH